MSDPQESNQDAFNRGKDAGKVDQRLEGHDVHFATINGSIARLADNVSALVLVVQRLADKFDASEVRVVATAAALKEADVARRDKADQSWSPLARWSAAIAIVTALISAYFLLRP